MFDLCDQNCEHLLTNEWEFTAYCKCYLLSLSTNGCEVIKCSDCRSEKSRKLIIDKYIKGEPDEK